VADRRRLSLSAFVAIGLAAAAALVILVAPRADSSPDGLEKVAADTGIDATVRSHAIGGSPFADYGTAGVGDGALGTIVAGLVGVAATFLLGAVLVSVVRRRRGSPPPTTAPSAGPSA
jgi:cobalt/nickel transport system permease protein